MEEKLLPTDVGYACAVDVDLKAAYVAFGPRRVFVLNHARLVMGLVPCDVDFSKGKGARDLHRFVTLEARNRIPDEVDVSRTHDALSGWRGHARARLRYKVRLGFIYFIV